MSHDFSSRAANSHHRLRSLLAFIAEAGERGRMEVHVCANGAAERDRLQRLYDLGWVERCDFRLPRTTIFGVRATAAGRDVLRSRPNAGG